MSEQRTDEEYAQALKVIKILVKHKLISGFSTEKDYLKSYDAAFEIVDLLDKH
jgi:hypothetical protein